VNAWGVRGSALPCRDDFDITFTDLPSLLSGGLDALDLPINNVPPFFTPKTTLSNIPSIVHGLAQYKQVPSSSQFLLLITLLLQYALVFLPGLPVGRLFDRGYFKLPLFCASVILVGATFATAECKEYWQFLLVQGLVIGLACGLAFSPVIAAVATYCKCMKESQGKKLTRGMRQFTVAGI
jgi:MFS family permease